MNEIRAAPGAFCPAGTPLGTVGRTGKNAWPSRSPTHLHLIVLEIKGSDLLPFDRQSLPAVKCRAYANAVTKDKCFFDFCFLSL
jgi:hypothetical protein